VNLNAREKKIAIGVLAAVVFMILYYVAFEPYTDARAQVSTDLTKVRADLEHADTTFSRERKLRPVWNDMQKGGLNVDPAQAERQTLEALNVWAHDAGLTLVTYKPERTTQEGTFQTVGISASGTGGMPQVARMLASIETAGIPVRVNDMTLTPSKEGTDDLTVRFSLSALCQPPAAPISKPNGTSNGGQS
jgi:Tfp pilus assembly protein PilO